MTLPTCFVCGNTREHTLADAIAHAPCDQAVARFPHDPDEHTAEFWDSIGKAVVYNDQ